MLEPLPEDDRFATWHLALPDGSLAGGGTGLRALLRSMRLTRRAGRVLERLPDSVLNRFYVLVSGHRAQLGRLVPDGPAPRRFP